MISISGQGSLFMIVSRTGFGLIAESLEDKKRIPVYQHHQVSTLEDISIYTKEGDVPLREVFLRIFEKEGGKECIDPKEGNDKLKKYFETVLPDYDDERVYVSDMKKVFKWYNQLVQGNHIDAESLKPREEEPAAGEADEEKTEKKKTTKKTAAKKDKEEAAEPAAEGKKKETKKAEPKKTATKKKTAAPKVSKAGPVKNAPAKKVQGVRKAGGS